MKQLGDDPWQDLARRYPPQTRIFGKVTNIADYGCFVEIEDGVEGLVHVSEMDWTNKNVNPSRVVSVGEEVEVMVIEIDEERRRISLGIKQCKSNPWAEFAATFNRNDKVTGQIKSITDFGIFIGLDGGIDGLVHLSDISWDDVGEDAVRKNSIVTGTVTEVDARSATVDLGEGVIGTLRASELARGRVEDARTMIKVGEEVEAKFTNVDRKNRSIQLSIKAKEVHEEQEAVSSYKSDAAAAPVGTTLGELLKEKMSGGSKK